MINTTEIRRLLIKIAKKPSKKGVDKLAILVSELCDDFDSKEPGVLDIIKKNQDSIETTFGFIKSLQRN